VKSPFAKIRHHKKRAFLAAFAQIGTVSGAAEASKCNRASHYVWRKTDAEYASAFLEAQDMAADVLEAEAVRRARDGWEERVYENGELVRSTRKFSNTLLMFLLKGMRPEKFRERYSLDHGISDGMIDAIAGLVSRHLAGPALDRFTSDLDRLIEGDGNGRERL
jgi:hypothetical protein